MKKQTNYRYKYAVLLLCTGSGRRYAVRLLDSFLLCVCVRASVVVPFILDVRLLDVPAGVTQEEGHTGFLIHLLPAVRALVFLARRIQPFLSLVDREVEFCVLTNQSFSTCWAFFFFSCEEKSQFAWLHRDSNSRPNVRRFSKLPTEPPAILRSICFQRKI